MRNNGKYCALLLVAFFISILIGCGGKKKLAIKTQEQVIKKEVTQQKIDTTKYITTKEFNNIVTTIEETIITKEETNLSDGSSKKETETKRKTTIEDNSKKEEDKVDSGLSEELGTIDTNENKIEEIETKEKEGFDWYGLSLVMGIVSVCLVLLLIFVKDIKKIFKWN